MKIAYSYECIRTFSTNPLHADLRNHALKGKFKEYRSIDITGDFRAIYLVKEDEVIFDMVGRQRSFMNSNPKS